VNIVISDTPLTLDSLGYISLADCVCPCIFNHFYVIGSRSYRIR